MTIIMFSFSVITQALSMYSIEISVLRKDDQGNELQRRQLPLHNNFLDLQFNEKKWQMYLKPFSCGPPMRHTHAYTHTLRR